MPRVLEGSVDFGVVVVDDDSEWSDTEVDEEGGGVEDADDEKEAVVLDSSAKGFFPVFGGCECTDLVNPPPFLLVNNGFDKEDGEGGVAIVPRFMFILEEEYNW